MEQNSNEQGTHATSTQSLLEKCTRPYQVLILGCLVFGTVFTLLYVYFEREHQLRVQETIPFDIEENESYNDPGFTSPDEVDYQNVPELYPLLKADTTNYSAFYKHIPQQEGVVWFSNPVSLGPLDIFTYVDDYDGYTARQVFYQIGTYFDDQIIFTSVRCLEPGCSGLDMILVGSPQKGYSLVTKHSVQENYYITMKPQVWINDELEFAALKIAKSFDVDGVTFEFRDTNTFFSDFIETDDTDGALDQRIEFVKDTQFGPLYRKYLINIDGGVTAYLYHAIRLPGGVMAPVSPDRFDFIGDDQVPAINWVSGGSNDVGYRTGGVGGCGSGGPEVMLTPVAASDLALAGYTSTNQPIYNLINPQHYLITRAFDITGGKYYVYDEALSENIERTVTPEEFIRERGVLIYVGAFGLQHVFTNTKFGPQAECGKPVIYLYPETETEVTVSVDARITKSDPEYAGGWKAIASPDGTLSVNGATYESLYWDGYGNGSYPELTQGFVVKTESALQLMSSHLTTMGFNEKEIADFVEFWEPHLPKEPFTRFSWIGTQGMESLAKLTIDPKPDTLIRAFIDFDGLETPVSIEPQRIPSYERIGYVATEWGGLLRR